MQCQNYLKQRTIEQCQNNFEQSTIDKCPINLELSLIERCPIHLEQCMIEQRPISTTRSTTAGVPRMSKPQEVTLMLRDISALDEQLLLDMAEEQSTTITEQMETLAQRYLIVHRHHNFYRPIQSYHSI